MVSEIDQKSGEICLPIPFPHRVFRNQAMDDILELLYRNPHESFGVRQLRELTGHGGQTVDDAIELFTQLGLIRTRRAGNRKLTRIDRERIRKPDDPLLDIPQEEFRTPVDAFLEGLRAEPHTTAGVLLFGSVARGTADRASDIDVLVVVADDLLPSRRTIQEIGQQLGEQRFDGDRYAFQVMVESIESAAQYGEKLQPILAGGITLQETAQFREIRREILHGSSG